MSELFCQAELKTDIPCVCCRSGRNDQRSRRKASDDKTAREKPEEENLVVSESVRLWKQKNAAILVTLILDGRGHCARLLSYSACSILTVMNTCALKLNKLPVLPLLLGPSCAYRETRRSHAPNFVARSCSGTYNSRSCGLLGGAVKWAVSGR